MYSGHVYNKTTNTPIAHLRVSDGLNIVLTDENGAFALPGWEKAHIISVQCLTKAHDDWYFHIEGHEGDYEFYITPAEAAPDHRFFQISDTEIDCVEEADIWLPFVKKQIAANPAAFLIQTGDICRREGLESHYRAMNYDVLGIPVRYCMGNHDYVDDRYGDYTFEKYYGPSWYSFDQGNTHYIVLPMRGGDAPSAYTQDEINRWIYNDMQAKDPEKSLVMFCHTHSLYEDTFVYELDDVTFDLRDYGLLAWVFGHYHINWVTDLGGYYNICTSRPDCGGIDSSPTAIRSIEIYSDHTLKTKLHYNDLSKAAPADNALWETSLPGHVMYATPILENGKLYIATCCDEIPFDAGLYCLNPENGEVLWSYKTVAGLKNVPSIDGGVIFAQDTFGWVYALNTDTGALVWKSLAPVNWGHHAENGVLAAEGKVFCGAGRKVVTMSQKDGSILWIGERSISSEDCPSRFILAHDKEGRSILLACRQWRHIYALDAETGEALWRTSEPRYFTGTPLVIGEHIYLHAKNNLFRLNLTDGHIEKQVSPDDTVCFNTSMQSVVHDGVLYTATADRGMLASDLQTFETIRTYAVGPTICPMSPYQRHTSHECESEPIFVGDSILFTSPDGYLHICNTETTEEVRAISLGAPCYVAPVQYKDTVICADFCGHIRAFTL